MAAKAPSVIRARDSTMRACSSRLAITSSSVAQVPIPLPSRPSESPSRTCHMARSPAPQRCRYGSAMLISPYGCSSSRWAWRSGRFWTAVMVSPAPSSARTAPASSAMTHGTQVRMAPQTWGATRRRATPCGRGPGNQLSLVMPATRTVMLLTVLLLGACARSDLGAPCHVENAAGGEIVPQPGRQYLYLGSSECESFACLATQGANSGYCSQACSGPGGSCPAGMSCAQLALSPEYLATLKTRLAPDRYTQLFGQLGSSFYCVRSQ